MNRAWPFLLASVICAYLGPWTPEQSVYAGPVPNPFDSGWHVAGLFLGGIFVGVLIGSYRR